MSKVGVLLSGCGVYDGAEIHESVITLLALDRAGADVLMVAPDVELEVVDHLSGEQSGERRNVLKESARIARGEIKALRDLSADDIDALILPGGFGAAKNLSDFATRGAEAVAIPEVARILREMRAAGKPIGAICIAPSVLAAALGEDEPGLKLTIGNDEATAGVLEELGASHENCEVHRFVVDEERKIVSTPAYMLAERISEAAEGIERLVVEVLRLVVSE
ncbi:MAG: isoprenoid biosynthesis glyoxalase ElbB [Candidatus Krumholzibacteria bacterium]|jgi:enhancing lycopene biosynthesis protein 2|nr:isoprenoid biosynthesis glyoxalase ElbB [Candidatus Krumholzibacteria bacterium]MDP6668616.1 isoprenoid biosynthesis glyoxalase ElbB [Candidatus Krumholzibacteria bacterium]MDP6797654.1 isoprenoid biosynthesis glyoxalase ElbB [Candidatus Krumholzibacteria bacterium]MDP7022306.1 isoprenoid biosynthesis glyoxalase ElbB [Candidatus Krumholzibacteria bacterium]